MINDIGVCHDGYGWWWWGQQPWCLGGMTMICEKWWLWYNGESWWIVATVVVNDVYRLIIDIGRAGWLPQSLSSARRRLKLPQGNLICFLPAPASNLIVRMLVEDHIPVSTFAWNYRGSFYWLTNRNSSHKKGVHSTRHQPGTHVDTLARSKRNW